MLKSWLVNRADSNCIFYRLTRWNERILTALFSEKEALELGLEENASILGNIYIGKINRIIKNLNAAFVDFGDGQTGYYSLEDNPISLPTDSSKTAISSKLLKGNDEIIVQVAKDAKNQRSGADR